ncbi:hypothetical protein CHLNCDRAFT_133915 [Chlorella variabilis]|uniref:Aminotransferase class I/classII large domain-containing protein n=1 Tax=Chlorella variabilis TaxID=554065 RepID=E1ZEK4_CHLVA|nr:hypothetical protein CHLNCDRAFT_133915 [Chlorella variabilis]EFN55510.1 hypothetical protein CHLNCDRAFT_133915 [Chlorella variabilis]|eukprot:XP_005847612.1 hypothetical protein CHLNCDRAFT_133915 [Chlorella variabilis]
MPVSTCPLEPEVAETAPPALPSLLPTYKHAERQPLGALDVASFFSVEGAARKQGTLRSLAGQFAGMPGTVSLGGGFPPASLFPFTGLSLQLASGGAVNISDPAAVASAQQYNFSLRGYQPLLQWVEGHVGAMHSPPAAGAHQSLITNGGNHTLEMIMALFMDRGDSLLLEEYSYPVMTESLAQPKGLHAVPVPIDAQGIIPHRLEALLEGLRAAAAAGSPVRFPKLLYTVPVAQNPTGKPGACCTVTSERRAAVYRLCQRYNLLLVEDDAYFFLQYPSGPDAVPGLHGLQGSGSYLSLDVDGRVIRVESFAKFMAPGLRLGWVTAHPQIIDKLAMIIQSHTVGPCSLAQVVMTEALKAWGDDGLDAHLRMVQREYATRAEVVAAACQKHLAGLAEWTVPSAGMFLWLRLLTVEDASEIWGALKAAKVVLMPGRAMHCRSADPAFRSPYMRVSYSYAPPKDLEEGMRRLGQVLREHAAAQVEAADVGAAAKTGMLLG